MRTIIWILIILSFSTGLSAKKLTGYVLTNQNDTIKCYIIQDIFVLSGIDISRFQNGIVTKDYNNKKMTYLPKDIKGFGIIANTDTIKFEPVLINSFEMFSGFKDRWFFMNLIDDGPIKLYYFIDIMTEVGSGYTANRRVQRYAIKTVSNEVAKWIDKTEGSDKSFNYRNLFIELLGNDNLENFKKLNNDSSIGEVLDEIYNYNITHN
ncbi:MAG: hypothetical protein Q8S18_01995 [Bacteroidales bacterium]|nr:hypothetical protein [Bacteroidales bacterium]